MQNIEIHGFKSETANAWRERIFEESKGKDFEEKMVVTIFHTDVKNSSKVDAPFLRLVLTDDFIQELVEMLRALGIDIEIVILEGFIKGTKRFDWDSPPPEKDW